LVHIAFGRGPDGRLRVAKGVIAIGQFAVGLITIAQFGIGFLFGLGQMIAAPVVIGQLALGVLFSFGQVAIGYIAIGQVVVSYYGLAQLGLAKYIWTFERRDPEAVIFFKQLLERALTYIKLPL
jgi:hypothetical protein